MPKRYDKLDSRMIKNYVSLELQQSKHVKAHEQKQQLQWNDLLNFIYYA